MAITLVVAVTATPGIDGGVTSGIDTTGATLLVVSVAAYSSPAPTVSDSKGNTWTALMDQAYSFNIRHRWHYCLSPTVGAAHTVTVTGTGTYPAVHVYAFAGVGSYDTESGTNSAASSVASGSVTPSANGALVLTGLASGSAATDAVAPGGFTLSQVTFGSGTNMQGTTAYYVQPTAAAIDPTWTWTGGSHSGVAVTTAVFLAGAPPAAERVETFLWGPI